MSEIWIILIVIAVLGPAFTFWWWKLADQWADAEHRRFKPKAPDPEETRVIVTGFDQPRDPPDAGDARSR
jgi:hypothetical protein